MSDKPKNMADIDNFWDLESLLPKKRPVNPGARRLNTDTVEISVGSDDITPDKTSPIPPRRDTDADFAKAGKHDVARRLNELPMRTRAEEYRSKPLDPYRIYEVKDSLIRRVEVSAWSSRFNFYENFLSDAKRLWGRAGTPCDHVSFFSYVPQYSQLKYAQLKWYLWWRENVRNGVYLKTDFCYILLYIYEIINAPDILPPQKGVEKLCDIWLNYRAEHRRIDSYMCDWLCDYCLIHGIPCPFRRLEPIIGDIVETASLKEFYIDTRNGDSAARILAYSSSYDWHKSRYVTPENVELFAYHIKAAFEKAYKEILSEKDDSLAKEFRMERTAYDGALCVYSMKRTIAVEYISYTRSPRFRFTVTDIIKYSENRIRMALGIKSRLKTESLTDKLKACLDAYFDEHLPPPKKSRVSSVAVSAPVVHEYDKLYEPVTSSLSLENALEIEKNSWSTTEILVSAFDDIGEADAHTEAPALTEELPPIKSAPENGFSDADATDEFEAFVSSVDDKMRDTLKMLADGDGQALAKSAQKYGLLADALADMINEAAFDIIGDSIIEADGGAYRFISDYEGDIKKWLK